MIIRMKMQNRYVSHHERNSIIMNIIQYLTYINIMFFYDFFFAVSRIQDSLRIGESPCPVSRVDVSESVLPSSQLYTNTLVLVLHAI